MLQRKGGGTWLWLLERDDAGHTRLITRLLHDRQTACAG